MQIISLPKEFRAWTKGFGCIPHVPGVAVVVRWPVGQGEWEVTHAAASHDLHATVQGLVRERRLTDALKGLAANGTIVGVAVQEVSDQRQARAIARRLNGEGEEPQPQDIGDDLVLQRRAVNLAKRLLQGELAAVRQESPSARLQLAYAALRAAWIVEQRAR